ncbi:MAG: phosphate ABC transporter permease PstA [Dehalococcoidales bacterium]|nr:phosphate ABC transporter permease PstA [Dehalococcoidales bacterium]
MRRRRAEEVLFRTLMIGSVAIVVGVLLTIVIMVTWKGLPALNIAMITQTPKGGYYLGGGGGILNAIVGSLYLAAGATVLAFLLSLPVALFLQREYVKKSWLAGLIRLSMDILWGIPSIVYGAFGFIIMLYLGIRASLLGGIIALTLLEIPVMVRAMDEVIRTVPQSLKDASYSLGATRLETSIRVVAKQVAPGILTAVLLAFGRGIGDAAAILFTAGYTDRIPTSLFDPVASLPLAVFFQLGTPFPEVQQRAYASAVILLLIILLISVALRLLSKRLSKHTIK